ncbi:MAG: DEAD/DEAH box helicase [Myxococcaceae bacterium]
MSPPSAPLFALLPPPSAAPDAELLLSRFLEYVSDTGLTLYPAQEEALLEVMGGKNVVLNTPTGSGKSLVATALHFKALAEGKTSVYTTPIKALANEKFFTLCQLFGPSRVGMLTGDASINRSAPILCCTAEVLANISLRESKPRVDAVVMDEFHYYGDAERGWAWQVPLLALPEATFLLMSATLGDTRHIEESLARLTRRPVARVSSGERPVPLEFSYRETPLHETLEELVSAGRAPVYLVNFTQRAAAEQAQALTSVNLTTREEKERIRAALEGTRFDSPFGKDMRRYLQVGIGLHHAGLLPKYRLACEKLAQTGLLKVVSGTDTLGVGVNIPIRTVLFTQLCKYDGEKTALLSARDFHQIAGRAGRKGFDERGFVVAQAPEHVIENLRLAQKSAAGKKVVRKQPPARGYVPWDRSSFEKLVARPPEPLASRFDVTFGMLLNLLQGDPDEPGGGYGRLVRLTLASHSSDYQRGQLLRKAAMLFRTLRSAGLLFTHKHPHAAAQVEVAPGLQREFSLHQTLSLYLLAVLESLDPASASYALDVVTLVESILENPEVVLLRQRDALRTARMAELKASGVEYAERLAELEKVDYPKPLADFIYGTFDSFSALHPWVGQENIRPKSIARDMLERFCSFADYVREYELQRSEGALLRYLTDAYKTLVQTVPESYRTEELEELMAALRQSLRDVDSSLLDEWERLQLPPGVTAEAQPKGPVAPTQRAVKARLRAELHRLLRALATRAWEEALAALAPGHAWTAADLEAEMAPYFAEHPSVLLTPEARRPDQSFLKPVGPRSWEARQRLLDPDGHADWMLECAAELPEGPLPDHPLLELRRVGV